MPVRFIFPYSFGLFLLQVVCFFFLFKYISNILSCFLLLLSMGWLLYYLKLYIRSRAYVCVCVLKRERAYRSVCFCAIPLSFLSSSFHVISLLHVKLVFSCFALLARAVAVGPMSGLCACILYHIVVSSLKYFTTVVRGPVV